MCGRVLRNFDSSSENGGLVQGGSQCSEDGGLRASVRYNLMFQRSAHTSKFSSMLSHKTAYIHGL